MLAKHTTPISLVYLPGAIQSVFTRYNRVENLAAIFGSNACRGDFYYVVIEH